MASFGTTLKNLVGSTMGKAGKAIDTVGKSAVGNVVKGAVSTVPGLGSFNSPDRKISEQLEYAGSILNPVKQTSASSGVQGASTSTRPSAQAISEGNAFQDYMNSLRNAGSGGSNGGAVGASGGQAAGGGGGGDSGGGYDYMGALKSAFSQSRDALNNMLPTYDSDFSNFESTVKGGIDRAKETLGAQNADDERIFGQDLKKTLQTDKELRQRRQGVFSGLNALDSSAYLDDTLKADQSLQDNTQSLDAEKRRNFDQRQREYAGYEQEANSKIESYKNEITRAKQALQQSIANVNMEEAASIQDYIGKLANQAQTLEAQKQATALNLAQLQAQGTDVIGNLKKTNLSQFSNLFGQNLSNNYNNAIARYTIPGGQSTGSGYISSATARLSEDQKKQLGLLTA